MYMHAVYSLHAKHVAHTHTHTQRKHIGAPTRTSAQIAHALAAQTYYIHILRGRVCVRVQFMYTHSVMYVCMDLCMYERCVSFDTTHKKKGSSSSSSLLTMTLTTTTTRCTRSCVCVRVPVAHICHTLNACLGAAVSSKVRKFWKISVYLSRISQDRKHTNQCARRR